MYIAPWVQWVPMGACSMAAQGTDRREFVWCDIQVHRIVATHHFHWVFSLPSGVTVRHSWHGCVIHYDNLGRVHLSSAQDWWLHFTSFGCVQALSGLYYGLRTVLLYIHCIFLCLLQNYYTEKFRPLSLHYQSKQWSSLHDLQGYCVCQNLD